MKPYPCGFYGQPGDKCICTPYSINTYSDDDSNPDKWREAVAKDKIEMFHHVLRGLKTLPDHTFDKTNNISEAYAVHYLPTKYLIDREGKIVGKFTTEDLEAKLKEFFE